MKALSKICVSTTVLGLVAALAACSSTASTTSADGPRDPNAPSWCGPKKVEVGLSDGFGGNAWRNVGKAEAEDEASKCSSVTGFSYTDGRGDTQKAISDLRGQAAKGVKALVVFADAGQAMLPAIRAVHKQGVSVVPYRVNPGGTAGTDYNVFIDTDFTEIGKMWADWLKRGLPNGGKIAYLGGPAANSQSIATAKGLVEGLQGSGIELVGQQPFNVTNWDPAKSQSVLSALLAAQPQLDAVLADDGNALSSGLVAFQQAGRPLPLIAAQDSNRLACTFEDMKTSSPDAQLFTVGSQTSMSRLAIQFAIADATGGQRPESDIAPQVAFENSVTDEPHGVECNKSLPLDGYMSSGLTLQQQIAVLK